MILNLIYAHDNMAIVFYFQSKKLIEDRRSETYDVPTYLTSTNQPYFMESRGFKVARFKVMGFQVPRD